MKIIIAPGSFKGSIVSKDVSSIIARGIKMINKNVEIYELPIADGGLGTLNIITEYFKGNYVSCYVTGPLGKKIKARYSIIQGKRLGIIELAQASGLHLIPKCLRNPLKTTTMGVGELIKDSIRKGCKEIIIGVGDSGTIDCGIGALSVLGIKFLDKNLKPVVPNCFGLLDLRKIDDTIITKKLGSVKITVLTDVSNHLTGRDGAIVYAPQKGAKVKDLCLIDQALKNFKDVIMEHYGIDLDKVEGAGAAGGIAGGLYAILKAKLISGFDFFRKITHIENHIKKADLIITGEGMIDKTTFYGKATGEIINICKKVQKPVIIVCGDFITDLKLERHGILKTYTLTEIAKNRKTAIRNAKKLLYKIGIEIGKRI